MILLIASLGVDLVLGINVVDVSEGDLIVDGLQEGKVLHDNEKVFAVNLVDASIDSPLGIDLVLGVNVVDVSEGDGAVIGLQEGKVLHEIDEAFAVDLCR